MAMLTAELCYWTRFSLAEFLVLVGITGGGGMAPPTSTKISARVERVHGDSSREGVSVGVCVGAATAT